MTKLLKMILSLVVLAVALPAQSMAEDIFETEQQEEVEFSAAVTDLELDEYRGGFSPTVMSSTMSAVLGGNSATNTVSGANTIGDGALNNVSGLTNIIQNSGNNVIIQSSFLVNVNFQ